MKAVQAIYDKTAGYKTRTGAVLLALYALIEAVAPAILKGQTEQVVRTSIDFLIITGGADWVWRNRHDIVNWIKELFTKKSNENGKREESR